MVRRAGLLDIDIADLCDLRRGGMSTTQAAAELNVAPSVAGKWTAHIRGDKRGLVVVSILRRAEAGEDLHAIASLENCSPAFVGRILRAWWREREARERLTKNASP